MSRIKDVTIDGVWTGYWIYWHNSELQVIKAPLVISTIHKSLLQTLSCLQPAVSSTAVSWKRMLIVEILQLPALRSFLSCEYPSTERCQFPGWRPFHTNLIVFSSQANFETNSFIHSRNFNSQLTTNWIKSKSQSYFTTGNFYRQSVLLGVKPLETHDQSLFLNWTLAVIVLISGLTIKFANSSQ
jgi:hypothetical protein